MILLLLNVVGLIDAGVNAATATPAHSPAA